MTDEFKIYILKNVPTKILLKAFKTQRDCRYKDAYDEHWNLITDYELCPDFIDYGNCEGEVDMRVKIIVPRFAYWNPNKGTSFTYYYSLYEVKTELNTREHIKN